MEVNSVNSQSHHQVRMPEGFKKLKESFDNLGTALESGNLSAAKDALSELQKNAPADSGKKSDPMSEKMKTLTSALQSGDIAAAQVAYADIKSAMSKRPSGPPPDMPDQGATAEATNSSGLLNTTA